MTNKPKYKQIKINGPNATGADLSDCTVTVHHDLAEPITCRKEEYSVGDRICDLITEWEWEADPESVEDAVSGPMADTTTIRLPANTSGLRCGHNFPPDVCPYNGCGYRDTLEALAAIRSGK